MLCRLLSQVSYGVRPHDKPMLSPDTWKRINLLFKAEEREEVAALLEEKCGNNLTFLEKLNEYELERYRFAALKMSGGSLPQLHRAIETALWDWRDLLMGAKFGHDVHAHEKWLPKNKNP